MKNTEALFFRGAEGICAPFCSLFVDKVGDSLEMRVEARDVSILLHFNQLMTDNLSKLVAGPSDKAVFLWNSSIKLNDNDEEVCA